ncbi:MAG TPA: YHS domain-containing (seleno)protein [Cytophagaceae bacterium]|jgi:YHS domain-containing protein|nr:YHS domain-containing (seleno)protein [Cytophagaceae bacterium]
MKNFYKIALLVFISVNFCQELLAQEEESRKKNFNVENGILLNGYDPVSYFSNKPTKGKAAFQYKYKGIKYLFCSQANLDKFKLEPEKYEPAYGGWCAYAMGEKGEKVTINPETFKITNGKLFVFYNSFFNNTLNEWNKDEKNLNKKADINWKSITK